MKLKITDTNTNKTYKIDTESEFPKKFAELTECEDVNNLCSKLKELSMEELCLDVDMGDTEVEANFADIDIKMEITNTINYIEAFKLLFPNFEVEEI